MVNHGIFKILTMADHDDSHVDGNKGTKAPATNGTTSKTLARGILLKFPFVACFLALVTVYLMSVSAIRHGFARDFENIASKVQDAFFYETNMKTYALREATSTAASIIGGHVGVRRFKQTKKHVKALQDIDETSLEIFQERSAAVRQSARIDRLTLHPIATDPQGETGQTCPQGSEIRKQAVRVIQESGNPVISDAWIRKGEDKNEVKTTIFYPISMGMPQEEVATPIGAVAADIKWADFFSPATLESKEGLIIAVENTNGQAFTFRVKDGRLVFIDFGFVYDKAFEDVVISGYSDFDMPSAQIISNSSTTEDGVSDTDERTRTALLCSELTSFCSSLRYLVLWLSIQAPDLSLHRNVSNLCILMAPNAHHRGHFDHLHSIPLLFGI